MTMKPITLWNGLNELSDQQHADNIEGLFQRISALMATSGAVGVHSISTAPITPSVPGIVVELSDGRIFGPFAMPMASMNWKDARIVGTAYSARDVIAWDGGTYIVLRDHTAAALLNDDLTTGNIAMMSRAGRDAETFVGNYVPGQKYARGSIVLKDLVFWKTLIDVAADGLAPGVPGSSWSIALYQSVPSANVFVTAEAKTLAAVIVELRAEIASLKTRLTNAGIA